MKNNLLTVILLISVLCLCVLTACGEKEEVAEQQNVNEQAEVVEQNNQQEEVPEVVDNANDQQTEEFVEVPKNEQVGTAGSNIPLKDNLEEAKLQIKNAFLDMIKDTYGEQVLDANVVVEKVYTAEEEQADEALKELNLGPNEVAFEVKYEIQPAAGVDANIFTAGTGEFDEESGWVKEKYNVGILRPSTEGDGKYVVTDVGTGW